VASEPEAIRLAFSSLGVFVCGLLHMSIVFAVDFVSAVACRNSASDVSIATKIAIETAWLYTQELAIHDAPEHHVSHHSHSCGREKIGTWCCA
jgi:hypothetical protein